MTDRSAFHAAKLMFLCAIALSIGWGIRGNFGHEYGAMIPGALAAMAGCCLSGRRDWQERVAYFGMFGGLGWAFGGSSSYMQVISYTHSGDYASQIYGYFGLFVLGFLWGAMGGAGTAFAAAATREQLTAIFKPILWIFAFWFVYNLGLMAFEQWEAGIADSTWKRHESLIYWFDTDWLEALVAIVAVCCLDLWERRFAKGGRLAAFAAIGIAAGWLGQRLLELVGLAAPLGRLVTVYQGDMTTLQSLPENAGLSVEAIQSTLLTNWPGFLVHHPGHAGWILGLVLACIVYFRKYGEFRGPAGLLLWMGLGWFIGFLFFPVMLSFGGEGFRMTPPRGDNWAGLIGVVAATLWWTYRNGLRPVTLATLVCGTIGGMGFAGAACLKLMMVRLGNPVLVTDADTIAYWDYWQRSNWHSFLEQTYGLFNGIGVGITLLLLMKLVPAVETMDGAARRTKPLAVFYTLFGILGLNLYKNVDVWVESGGVQAQLSAPWFEWFTFDALTWFLFYFAVLSLAALLLLYRHLRQPIALVPATALGKGQLLFIVLLWGIVIGNIERTLPGFSGPRLLTEGTIFLNAVLASVLILLWPPVNAVAAPENPAAPRIGLAATGVLAGIVFATVAFTGTTRFLYGDHPAGHASTQKRFGADAEWRIKPLQRGKKHS